MFSETPTRPWPQWLLVAFTVGLAAAVALSMALADDAQAGRTVTKTFSNTGTISFAGPGTGPASPYPSEIPVSFKKGSRVADVDLTLRNFTSNNPDDVAVMVAHGQTNQGVMSDTGGTIDVANITFTLDDEAAVTLPDATQLQNNTSYRPARFGADWPAPAPSALSVFDGEKTNGTWRLFVVDDGFGAEPAAFNGGWTLTIKAKLPRR
jgi:hypothetical protein